MKARITTVLSLTGVLVAGSAAALVNTQVLQGSAVPKGSGDKVTIALDKFADVVDQNASPVIGETTQAPVPTPEPPADPSLAAAAVTTQAIYQIGDAGLVTVDTAGDVLSVVSAVPNAEWTVLQAQNVDAYNIEVQFQMGTTLIEFRANLLFGVVGTSVETTNLDAGSGGTVGNNSVSPTANTTADDDDDDGDEHGDDDRGDDDD